jgi:SAM-dependent methyltransferase
MMQTREIYNNIATEFDLYRVKVWPCVKNYLKDFNDTNLILDIGCGNGKNIIGNPQLNIMGIDFSEKLVEICCNKKLNVTLASMTAVPYNNDMFDGFIAVASYHHLENDHDRKLTLNEMYRILKPCATGLIVVWAIEQGNRSKFQFDKKNMMVTSEQSSEFRLKNQRSFYVPWKARNGTIYERYYHIYGKGELVEEINRLEPRFKVVEEGWQAGNWYIVIQK